VWSFKRLTVLDFWNKIWNQKKTGGEKKREGNTETKDKFIVSGFFIVCQQHGIVCRNSHHHGLRIRNIFIAKISLILLCIYYRYSSCKLFGQNAK